MIEPQGPETSKCNTEGNGTVIERHCCYLYVVQILVIPIITISIVAWTIRSVYECIPILVFLLGVAIVRRKKLFQIQGIFYCDEKRRSLPPIGIQLMGIISGCVAGGIIGCLIVIVAYNASGCSWGYMMAIRVGAKAGAVIGAVYPSFTNTIMLIMPC